MAANTATLQVEVISKGVKEATDKLDSLGNAAARNANKVETLTGNIEKLMKVQNDSAASSAAYANMMWAIAQAMGQIATAAGQTARDVKNLNDALGGLTNANTSLQRSFQATVSGGGVVNTTLRAMATAASAYIGVNMAKGIIEASDGWQTMQAKLKIATGSMNEAKAVQEDLFNLAQKMRAPLDDMAKLYNRIATPMEKMGKDSKATMEQVEYLAASLKLAGATTAEASSVMLQYSQSVNSGKLQGGEFNAVAEASPNILRDIEKYLKSTGQMAEYGGMSLKEMASKGLITFDVLQAAAQMALPKIRQQMADLPETVDGAMARIKNAWFKAMGELGENTQLGKQLNQALAIVEANIPKIRDTLVSAFNFIVQNFDLIKLGLEAMLAVKLVGWAGEATIAIGGMASAYSILNKGLGPVVTAIGAATTATEAFAIAGRALLGPWGLVIAAIGTAAVFAYQKYKEASDKAEQNVTTNTATHVQSRIEMLNKEIAKYNERNAAANGGNAPTKPTESLTSPEQDAALKRMLDVQKQYDAAKKANNANLVAGLSVTLAAAQADYAAAAATQTNYLNIKKVNDEAERQGKITALVSKVTTEHASKLEAATAKVNEYKKAFKDLGVEMPTDLVKRVMEDMMPKSGKGPEDYFKQLQSAAKATADQFEADRLAQDGLTKSEALAISMKDGHVEAYNKMTKVQQAYILKLIEEQGARERAAVEEDAAIKASQQAATERDNYLKQTDQTTASLAQQTIAVRAQIAAINDSKTASKEMTMQELVNKAAMKDAEALEQLDKNGDTAQYEKLKAQADAYRDLAVAVRDLGIAQDNKTALDSLNNALDPGKALAYGNGMKNAFGSIGKAIDGAAKAYDQYGKKQKAIAKAQADLHKIDDPWERTKAENALRKESLRNELSMYAGMADAAKGFFSEKTVAYKAFNAFEQGLRMAQLAMDMEAMFMKLGLNKLFSAENEKDVIAAMALDGMQTDASVANSETRAAASGTAGIAKAFEQLGVWGFIGAAAIIAFLASIGVHSGGGGASMPSISEQRQKTQGTGTVLGDENAKSNSASKALEDLKSNADISLRYTSQMLIALRSIENGISGMAAAVAQSSGLRTTAADELAAGVGSSSGFLGFSSSSTNITDSGILFGEGQTVGGVKNAGTMGAKGYQDIHSESSSWWGLSHDSSDEERLKNLDAQLQRQMALTVTDFVDGLASAGDALGKSGESIKGQLEGFGIDIGRISLKGLTGDDITKQLEAAFSKLGDEMASVVLPGFQDFQKLGEGYFETVVRVASGYESASVALSRLHVGVIALQDVANKQGDVATEVVRQSLAMKEAGTGIADMINGLEGSASDLISTYKSLLDVREYLRATGLSDDVSRAMIAGVGSVDALTTGLQNYIKLLPQTKQTQVQAQKLSQEFARLGVTMPKSTSALVDLIDTYMAGDDASKALAAELMSLSGSFSDLFSTLESNVSDARSNLSDAYDRESQALEDTKTKFLDFAKSLREFNDNMLTGSDSPLTLAQKYQELTTEYQNNLSLARMGNEDAIGKFQDLANKMLDASREYNASGDAYTSDFMSVLQDSKFLAQVADSQVSVAEQQLDALNKQVDGLITVNTSVLTVAQAIDALHSAMTAAGYAIDGSHANGLSYVPFDGYKAELHEGERVLTKAENAAYMSGNTGSADTAALVSELQALRQEVSQLRQEQAQQTGAIIGANYDASERNAQTIVDGTDDAISKSDWKNESKVTLV
jgi:tape measure domain-containing protein